MDRGTTMQKEWMIVDGDGLLYGPAAELEVFREHYYGDYPESADIVAVPKSHGGMLL